MGPHRSDIKIEVFICARSRVHAVVPLLPPHHARHSHRHCVHGHAEYVVMDGLRRREDKLKSYGIRSGDRPRAGSHLSIQQSVQPQMRFENTDLTRRGTLCSCVSVSGDHIGPGPREPGCCTKSSVEPWKDGTHPGFLIL